jgi:regulator of protease activity HflC (stomatin/prohibitin superfamily)
MPVNKRWFYDEVIVYDTHRVLWYEDGMLKKVLGPGRYIAPRPLNFGFIRLPLIHTAWVDIRERDLTIKGQEILTADKVAIRVSIIVRFRVTDPRAVVHQVEHYEERLYTDVQLAARRSLAATKLEEILTDRNRLSEDILRDMKGSASVYGVEILRADVKDLIFPGNLQEIMNRVLAAERMAEAQLIDARTQAEVQLIEAQTKAEARRFESEAQAAAQRLTAQSEAEIQQLKTEADIRALREREQAAQAYTTHPALLRLLELETLRDLSRTANARIYISFDKFTKPGADEQDEG